MSYGVMAYLVDTEELLCLANQKVPRKSIFDVFKKKKSVKDDMIERHQSEFNDLDERIKEELENDDSYENPLFSVQILDEFLSNKFSGNSFSWAYAYTFEIICKYKGVALDNADWYPCTNENFYSIPVSFFDLPIKFPTPDEFPGISFIAHKYILLGSLKGNKFENIDCAQTAILKNWYERAFNEKKDVYLFYY